MWQKWHRLSQGIHKSWYSFYLALFLGPLTLKSLQLLTEKKYTTWELQVKFSLGQNEDCRPGGSTSYSTDRLLQRGSGGRSIYKILVKGEFDTIKHSFYKRFFTKKNLAKKKVFYKRSWGSDVMKVFSAFLDMMRYKHWNFIFKLA